VPKNLCRVCGCDFYRVRMFDAHRQKYRVVRGPGGTQDLVGECIAPEVLGYTLRNGVYYDDRGAENWDRLQKAREVKYGAPGA